MIGLGLWLVKAVWWLCQVESGLELDVPRAKRCGCDVLLGCRSSDSDYKDDQHDGPGSSCVILQASSNSTSASKLTHSISHISTAKMDFLKKAAGQFSESQHNNEQQNQGNQQNPNPNENQTQQNNAQPQQNDDYVDKAFSFASKKAGFNISRDQQEKITDAGRGGYEKFTGSHVDPKYSN